MFLLLLGAKSLIGVFIHHYDAKNHPRSLAEDKTCASLVAVHVMSVNLLSTSITVSGMGCYWKGRT